MRIRRNLALSGRALLRHPVRTGLGVAGVAIGVGAVLVMMATGEGAKREMLARIEAMGRDLLVVSAARAEPDPVRPSPPGPVTTLRPADAVALLDGVPGVEAVAPSFDRPLRVELRTLYATTTVRATSPAFEEIRDFRAARGRYFTAAEARERRRVAVLGDRVARDLFGAEDPLGTRLRIGGIPFEVVGVLEAKGASATGASDEDDQILIPLDTGLRRVFNVDYVTLVYVRMRPSADPGRVSARIARVLRSRHGLDRRSRPDDFAIREQRLVLEAGRIASASFRRLVTVLALLSLLVGGIGILSLMLLSIRERRGEIGLRIALGARRRDIRLQFVAEALMLGGGGGAAGVGGGVLAALAVGRATEWPTAVSPAALGLAVGAAVGVALAAGVLPAGRAARLDPIEALRAE